MPLWPLVGGPNRTVSTGVLSTFIFGGALRRGSDENETQQEVRDSYTASNLRAFISTFVGPNAPCVFRLNGADGSQAFTVTGTGEFEDTSNTDALVSGDLINFEIDQSAGGHSDEYTVGTFQVTLDASTDVPFIANGVSGSSGWRIGGGNTSYAALQGGLVEQSGAADVEYTMRATRTLRDLRVFCRLFNNNTTSTVQKNQINGNLTVTATGTGEFLDTANTDSFVAGDEVNYVGVSAGTMSNTILSVLAVEGNTPTTIQMWAATGVEADFIEFFFPSGFSTTTTEAEAEIEAEGIATIQNLFVNCFTHAENRTIRTRVNQANGNASVSVTGTGLFEDTSNTDTLAAEGDLAIQQDIIASSSGANDYLVAVEWDGAQAAGDQEFAGTLTEDPVQHHPKREVVSYGMSVGAVQQEE